MNNMRFPMYRNRKANLLTIDFLIIASVSILLTIIHEFFYVDQYISFLNILLATLIFTACIFAIRFALNVYSSIWRFARSAVYLKLFISDMIAGVIYIFINRFIGYNNIWLYTSIVCITIITTFLSRLIYQLYYYKCEQLPSDINRVNVAIVGAGKIGVLLAEELMLNNYTRYVPYCFIDNDKAKIGHKIAGIKVYDCNANIIDKIKNLPIQEIIIAIPSITGEEKQKIYNFYKQTGCNIKIYDYPFGDGGENNKRILREIRIEDLLFRKPVNLSEGIVNNHYTGKTVLVTGGGGSIGSEICRQIARQKPSKLIIYDIYENNAYEIQQELKQKYANTLNVEIEIGSVRDKVRLEKLFNYHRPEIVFHAAAHKHVPLMEKNSGEAIKNNVIGTYNTANLAEKYGVEKFILISTDKAVNPTNIMGATKRVCEMIILSRQDSPTNFAAVRFGNVLGSNGSVIPLFKQQIECGGPVTITDKRVIRYFMTISEASQLVIQAGVMAKKSELYVLDMGYPIKIYDLAENMIRLSGLRPNEDIKIIETGLRPGEKLYEELLTDSVNLMKTQNDLIFVEKDELFSRAEVDNKISLLKSVVDSDNEAIKSVMKMVVPTYREADEVNKEAFMSKEMQLAGA